MFFSTRHRHANHYSFTKKNHCCKYILILLLKMDVIQWSKVKRLIQGKTVQSTCEISKKNSNSCIFTMMFLWKYCTVVLLFRRCSRARFLRALSCKFNLPGFSVFLSNLVSKFHPLFFSKYLKFRSLLLVIILLKSWSVSRLRFWIFFFCSFHLHSAKLQIFFMIFVFSSTI